MKPLNKKYKARIARRYGVLENRFARVEIVEKESDRVITFCEVRTRTGRNGSDETRAAIIKEAAIKALRENKRTAIIGAKI